ncbi:MAG: long-chain-fatty-acid--CoA ligase [Candidatus Hydrogenedentes bacterium]|nr:long-chain-fatty-acid--CoA ligase [Candidatus Hydrogenedentota bacterium]
MTITHLLEERAQSEGERVFVFCEGEEVTYRDMRDRAKRVAANLHAAGVRKGDKIVLLMGNCLEFLYVFLGAGRVGAVVVPVNPMLKPGELAHIVSDSDAETIITIPEFAPLLGQAKTLFPSLKRFYVIGEAVEGAQSFSDLLEHPHEIPPIVAEHGDDAALIYTSGTTGKPKGVVLSHRNYLANARMLVHVINMGPSDRFLLVLPLFHVNAQVVSVLAPLMAHADVVLMKKFNPFAILPSIEKYRATILSAVPTIYSVMCRLMRAEPRDLSSMRLLASGAAPMPEKTYQETQEVLKVPLIMGYGLSEATCASAAADARDPIRWNSVGPALRYTSIRIVGGDGLDVPVGETGEILIAGPTVMKGYYKNPEATKEVLRDGWLRTGDLGHFDEDGYLYISGRLKEMIIRGGQNIYPTEVENVLSTMPGVEECCVVGVEDEQWGQEVLAAVKLAEGHSATANEVMDFCREYLAAYKCPRLVSFVSELPKTATGKIKKGDVAAAYTQGTLGA